MTSISSLTNSTSSTSSIYGNRNIISGLASGMDTETMIENAVKGYQTKITNLQQKQEMTRWKQEAYRSIIDKMVNLTRKYTSYTSSTNLFSPSFFNKAVKTVTNGKYADLVSAIGKTSSNIQLNGVKQLAQAAKRTLGIGATDLAQSAGSVSNGKLTVSSGELDLTNDVRVSHISGGMTMMYGNSAVYLDFGELDAYTSTEELAKAIEEKLGESQVKTGSGEYVKASDRIGVKVDGDKITFVDKANAGNSIYVSSATDNMQAILGFKTSGEAPASNVSFNVTPNSLSYTKSPSEYLSGKTIEFNLDGVTKTVTLPEFNDSNPLTMDNIVSSINDQLKSKFGDKIEVKADGNKLDFTVAEGSSLSVTSTAGKALGLGDNGLTSYLNTGKTLGDLLGTSYFDAAKGATQEAEVNLSDLIKLSGGTINVQIGDETKTINLGDVPYDAKSSDIAERINKQLEGTGVTVSANGANKLSFSAAADTKFEVSSGDTEKSDLFAESKGVLDLKVNGVSVGKFSEDDTLTEVMNSINGADTGVNIAYSKMTNEFSITAKDTGEAGEVSMSGGLAGLFGFNQDGTSKVTEGADGKLVDAAGNAVGTYTKGQDAIFTATVNGKEMELKRASNTFDMDGMSVTLKGAFGYDETGALDKTSEAVTFTTTSDSDAIVDAIKSFVEDYNEMVKEIHDAYSTLPNEKSSKDHSRYMPLTDEDKKGMSETAIKAYEEKAKQGILFGENDLSNLYRQLTSTIQMTGAENAAFKAMGITSSYSDGLTTLELDENALREALESDPDKVRDAFSKTVDNGASSNGLMFNMKKVLDAYANTSSGSMGLLIQKAGSKYSPNSVNSNSLQKEYDNFTTQIEKWQTKMSDQVDYYTRQFTALEQLVAQMNNQSSMLAGLQGGY